MLPPLLYLQSHPTLISSQGGELSPNRLVSLTLPLLSSHSSSSSLSLPSSPLCFLCSMLPPLLYTSSSSLSTISSNSHLKRENLVRTDLSPSLYLSSHLTFLLDSAFLPLFLLFTTFFLPSFPTQTLILTPQL